MRIRRVPFERGVTLTELLVVLAIISLLATLAVPVYINKVEQARVSIARSEVRTIGEAQQMVAITHGYVVPIHLLDNIPNPEDPSSVGNLTALDTFENDDNQGSTFLIDVSRDLFDQSTTQDTLAEFNSKWKVSRMYFGWQGPFLNPQRVHYMGQNPANNVFGDITADIVLDPWGRPYRLYSPLGLVGNASPPTNADQSITFDVDNGRVTSQQQDRFDRFAVVSWGPNGVHDFGSGNPLDFGDDIYYTFTAVPLNESIYQGF